MVFIKIKVNACILLHLISNYKIFGESFKNTLFYLYCQRKLERRLQFEQRVEIFPHGMLVENINSTLDTSVQ